MPAYSRFALMNNCGKEKEMHKKKISPSVMCADFTKLGEALRDFRDANIEYMHIDIMDGSFVPNFTLGVDFCKTLKKAANIPLDIHLMIDEPESKVDWFGAGEGDYISVHYESTRHICRALQRIRDIGAKPMVAINPGTPICVLENLTELIDGVLVMTVNPGFSGQKLVPGALEKIREVRAFLDARGCEHIEIEVDGNVSFENARKMSDAGSNIFVAGTSSMFNPAFPLIKGADMLREAIK